MDERIRITVENSDEGQRLDIFVTASIPDVSRSTVQRWIDNSRITVDGSPRRASFRLNSGSLVEITPLAPEPNTVIPQPLDLTVVFEDADLIVVDKPAGLVVHPGAGNRTGTLANALAHHFQQLSQPETLRPGIVHRLDKGTSGIILIAKNDQTHHHLARQFSRREVEKKYLALLFGRLVPTRGEIDLAIGRDPKIRTRISARSRKPRSALTEYTVLEHLERFSYVEARPRTGRTHQIRVHFHHLGHPVVGDQTYLRRDLIKQLPPLKRKRVDALERLFLHATLLRVRHPKTGEVLTFESPLPAELAELKGTLGE